MTTTSPTQRAAPTADASAAGSAARWLMLGVLLAGQFMALLDVTIVNVAMPTISSDLHASGASLQLIVSGYTVAYAVLLITGARLGDLFGRRRLYLIGISVFTLTSLACGLAPNTATLTTARFVQGAGAAMMMPQIVSVIQAQFAGTARAKALSAYSAVLAVGAVAGQIVACCWSARISSARAGARSFLSTCRSGWLSSHCCRGSCRRTRLAALAASIWSGWR